MEQHRNNENVKSTQQESNMSNNFSSKARYPFITPLFVCLILLDCFETWGISTCISS